MPKYAAVLGMALASVLAAGCGPVDRTGASADPFVVTIARDYWVTETDHFVHAVESISEGTVRVEFVEPESIEAEAEIVDFTRESGADLGLLPARVFHDLGVRAFDALHAPMLIDDFELERAVLESDIAAEMLRGLERIGLVGVGLTLGPIRRLVGVSGPLLAPEDFRRAHVAIMTGAPVAAHSLADLGARPYPIWLGDPLQLRGFDGLETSLRHISEVRLDSEAHSVVANLGLWPEPYVTFADAAAWERLPLEIRRVLRQAARSSAGSRAEKDSGDAEAVTALCRRGQISFVTATPAQRAALLDAFGPTYSWLQEDPEPGPSWTASPRSRSRSCPNPRLGAPVRNRKGRRASRAARRWTAPGAPA